LNGIYISHYYLIPSIPDILSTYGIPQILNRINNFKRETKIGIEPLGIVISMYRAQSRLHDSVSQDLRGKASRGEYPRVFNTIVPLTVRSAESADVSAKVNTLKQKYGYGRVFENYDELARELLSYV
jgi:chromosome partitioning protein